MKSAILLLAVSAAVLSSCSTAYKTGQTPDDVYYSPARQLKDNDNVQKEQKKDNSYSDEYYADRYLWMKVRNRSRWSDLNDWYNYDRYSYGYNYYYGSTNNPYNSWNYYYNPYCSHTNNYNYSYPKLASIKPIVKPHNFNLGGYTNTNYNNNNSNSNAGGNRVYTNTNNNNSNRPASKTIRTIFESNNNNNSSSSSSSTPSRTYTPSSSSSSNNSPSSSSSSSGSSGGGSVTRPGRN